MWAPKEPQGFDRAEVNLACRGDKVALTPIPTRTSFISAKQLVNSIIANIEQEAQGDEFLTAATPSSGGPSAAEVTHLSNPQESASYKSRRDLLLKQASLATFRSTKTIGSQMSKAEEEEQDKMRQAIQGMKVVTTMGLQELITKYGEGGEKRGNDCSLISDLDSQGESLVSMALSVSHAASDSVKPPAAPVHRDESDGRQKYKPSPADLVSQDDSPGEDHRTLKNSRETMTQESLTLPGSAKVEESVATAKPMAIKPPQPTTGVATEAQIKARKLMYVASLFRDVTAALGLDDEIVESTR